MKTAVFKTIRDVPKEDWNGLLVGASCTFTYEFWELIESAQLQNFDFRYVLFYAADLVAGSAEESASDTADNRAAGGHAARPPGRPVALASFYAVTTDIAIFAPRWLRGALGSVRKLSPGFLKLRMLECGTPLSLNSPPFPLPAGVPVRELIESLDSLLQSIAQAEGQALIVIRDFEPGAQHLQPEFERLGYYWGESLPNTYLDVVWSTPEQYLASMKSYFRSKLLRHLRRNEELQVRCELCEDFAPLADDLCRQWLVVHSHADEFQREVLTPGFYRAFSDTLGARSKALLFYRGDELIGHALLLHDGELLRWLYFGRNAAVNDSLYIFVGQKVIETAIKLGAKRLEMGLTTYPIKQDLGAQCVSIKMALRTVIRATNGLVRRIYPLINAPPALHNKNIFKAAVPPATQGKSRRPR